LESDGSSPGNLKEEAVRRLGLGVSVAEVAKSCEVNANVLHGWRREIQELGVKVLAGNECFSRSRRSNAVLFCRIKLRNIGDTSSTTNSALISMLLDSEFPLDSERD